MGKNKDYQQGLVLEQKYKLMETVQSANQALDDKANSLLQTGGVVVGLVATFTLSDLALLVRGDNTVGIPIISQISIAAAFILFLLSIWLYRQAQSPMAYDLPGSTDWDRIFNSYLYATPEACFDKVLSDLINSIDSMKELNSRKAIHIDRLGWLLLFQVAFLSVAVVFG